MVVFGNSCADALCIKSGADWLGRHVHRPTENVLFENIEVRANLFLRVSFPFSWQTTVVK